MPINTRLKRASAVASLAAFVAAPVHSDGSITTSDRPWAAHSYAGIVASASSGSPGASPGPSGGGTVNNTGIIPPQLGLIPSNPLTFVHIRTVAGDDYYFAPTQLNDDAGWHGGKKAGKLLHVSDIKRRLGNNGQFEGHPVTVRIADEDRLFRTLVASTPLRGSYFAVYWVDDDDRRFEQEPFRLFAGHITSHRSLPGFIYEFTAHDTLSARLALINQQPTLPPDRLSASVFPGLDQAIEGHAAPIVIGEVSDEAISPSQGVVSPKFLGGPLNFASAFGGINHDVDVYLLSKCALTPNGVWQGYYNDPADPSVRLPIPGGAWGSVIWAPGMTGWSDVGVATDYIDYNGERYTPFFISRSLGALADAVRDGRVLVAFNLYGVEEVGDGSGNYLDSPARIWQWLLVNFVFTRYTTGNYIPPPLLDGTYAVIDTVSVSDAHDAHDARISGGYVAGFVLGRDGRPQSLFEVLGELCQGADMDQGYNRHGQLMLSVEDPAATALMSFTSYDIEDGTYETWIDTQQLVNRVEQEYGYLYTPPFAPAPTPPTGEPVPTKPLGEVPKWDSGVVVDEDVAAQAAIGGEVVTLKLQNYVIRDPLTAEDVSQHILDRGLGPTGEGPRLFRMRGGPWMLGENTSPPTVLDLGSVFEVTHHERVGTDIITPDKCRILEVVYHPLKKRVTYEGRVLVIPGTPPSAPVSFTNGQPFGGNTLPLASPTSDSLTGHINPQGTDRIGFVVVWVDSDTDILSSVTWGGVDITANLVGHTTTTETGFGFGIIQVYVFSYIGPPTGSSAVTVTCSTLARIYAGAVAYAGARQHSQPDNVTITSGATSTSFSSSLTPLADGCFVVAANFGRDGSPPGVGAGTVERTHDFTQGVWSIVDNDAAVSPAASTTLTTTRNNNLNPTVHITFSIAPVGS